MVIRLTALQGTYFSSSLQQNTNLLKENNYDKLIYSNQDSSKVMGGEVQITIKQYEPIRQMGVLDNADNDNDSKPNNYNTINAIVYGYTSLPHLTDNTPCITASGLNVCNHKGRGVIANNCYSFDSVVVIGGISYDVNDRMNARYPCNVFDIWFPTYEEAINWGRREVEVKIYN